MPTEYVMEVFDISGTHKPVARFVSDTPFHTVHVGDRFDDTGWQRLDGVGGVASPTHPVRYVVHSIKHLVEHAAEGLVVRYCLNLAPHSGPASPVWGDEKAMAD